MSDFLGGLFSRRLDALTVVFAVEAAGLVIAGAGVLVLSPPWFDDTGQMLAAAGAGVSGIVGLTAFYRALAVGTMSIVAPVGSTGVAVPVAVGVATGHGPGAIQFAGILVAATGIVLAGREAADESGPAGAAPGLGLALLAALGFGGYFVGADYGADGGVLVTLLVARAVAVPGLALLMAFTRAPLLPPDARTGAQLFGVGAIDLLATGLYALATTKGLLAVVSVLGALYPVTTVLLARGVLGERLQRVQLAGVAVALTGVALIAAG